MENSDLLFFFIIYSILSNIILISLFLYNVNKRVEQEQYIKELLIELEKARIK